MTPIMKHLLLSNSRSQQFISVWKTDNSGTSTNNQITLPLESSGIYDFTVDWGDGTRSRITAYNQTEVTHTYAIVGTYTVKISGTIQGFRFNNNGDKLKLLEIKKWGNLRLGNNAYYFKGCTNLIITATDILNLTGTINLDSMFDRCYSIITIPSINNWNVSKVTNMAAMFEYAIKFNQDISNWDISSVSGMRYMLHGASAFNQDISWRATTHKLNWRNVVDLTAFLYDSGINTTNYDKFLIGLKAQNDAGYTLKSNVPLSVTVKYGADPNAITAHDFLTGTKGWTITDGGLA